MIFKRNKETKVKSTSELADDVRRAVFWKRAGILYWVVIGLLINVFVFSNAPQGWNVWSIVAILLFNVLFVLKVLSGMIKIKEMRSRYKNLAKVAQRLQEIKGILNR